MQYQPECSPNGSFMRQNIFKCQGLSLMRVYVHNGRIWLFFPFATTYSEQFSSILFVLQFRFKEYNFRIEQCSFTEKNLTNSCMHKFKVLTLKCIENRKWKTLNGLWCKYYNKPQSQCKQRRISGECVAFLSSLTKYKNPQNKLSKAFATALNMFIRAYAVAANVSISIYKHHTLQMFFLKIKSD